MPVSSSAQWARTHAFTRSSTDDVGAVATTRMATGTSSSRSVTHVGGCSRGTSVVRSCALATSTTMTRSAPRSRACAALALGEIPGGAARALLEKHASDKHETVRTAVKVALSRAPDAVAVGVPS